MTGKAGELVIELRELGFDRGPIKILEKLELQITAGELVMCVGPSGCGKSTLLALIGGHLQPSRGAVTCHGRSRTIHQQDGLFPWLNVRQNIERGLPPSAPPQRKAGARRR
jgi:NitT/TauT family transport system ATP-binding protein